MNFRDLWRNGNSGIDAARANFLGSVGIYFQHTNFNNAIGRNIGSGSLEVEKNDWSVPTMNIAGSEAVSILELAKLIATEIGYEGEILVEESSNNGTSVKLLDDTVFRNTGWSPKVQLKSGIKLLHNN